MKIKIILIIGLVIIGFSLCWALDKPLVDTENKKIDEEIKRVTEECMNKEKSPVIKFKCGDDIRKKYEQQGKIRGTEEYCEFNYISLSFNELEKLFRKLKTQQKTARSSMDLMWDDELPGEVTKEDLQTELMWVESRLARMQKAKVDRMEKSLK